MTTAAVAGVPLTPCALADDKGGLLLMTRASSATHVERALRAACDVAGGSAGLASSPMLGAVAKRAAVPHSLSVAWHIGMALLRARAGKGDVAEAVLGVYQGSGRLLWQGKVADVERRTSRGFVRGSVTIEGAPPPLPAGGCGGGASGWKDEPCGARALRIDFQNENLVARVVSGIGAGSSGGAVSEDTVAGAPGASAAAGQAGGGNGKGEVLACVPDIICCLDAATGAAIATEELRYGLRLSVLALPAHPLLRAPRALAVMGPGAFGYEGVEYTPVGEFLQPTPVHLL
jgi:DUF917 family protein